MTIKRIMPLLNSDKLEALKAFYTTHLGFEVTFDGKGYLGLKSPDEPHAEIGFMKPCSEESVAAGGQCRLCLEVDDVDGEYARLSKLDLADEPPKDNPWGDRAFEIVDPGGFKLYIYKPIPPSAEYAAYVKE